MKLAWSDPNRRCDRIFHEVDGLNWRDHKGKGGISVDTNVVKLGYVGAQDCFDDAAGNGTLRKNQSMQSRGSGRERKAGREWR